MHSQDDLIADFHKRINKFVNVFVPNRITYYPENKKIIHDPVWGTVQLHPWEVVLLDLPLFQRMRQISQTSLVNYVFPGCNHSRFEHTIGVIHQTQSLINAINNQQNNSLEKPFDSSCTLNLRLAALFHDCGHSCFSHLSEEIYAHCQDIKQLLATEPYSDAGCNSHEALSAEILKSDKIRKLIEKLARKYKIEGLDVDAAANWIIGHADSEDERYKTQVINGPFDADKLDYIFRDAHYSGIPLGVDLNRLWASCSVQEGQKGRLLTLHQSSVAPLEQILFSKINLFAIVYQHPKVRAAENMFHAAMELIREQPSVFSPVDGEKLTFEFATDYLWLTDEIFYAGALSTKKNNKIHRIIHDIRYRRLFVRALTISNDTVVLDNTDSKTGDRRSDEAGDDQSNIGYARFKTMNQNTIEKYQERRELAEEICKEAGIDNINNVWVDVPRDPKFSEANKTLVRTADDDYRPISKLFPIEYWVDLFKAHKWRAHIFCQRKDQKKVYKAAIKVLDKNYGMKLKKSAGSISRVPCS